MMISIVNFIALLKVTNLKKISQKELEVYMGPSSIIHIVQEKEVSAGARGWCPKMGQEGTISQCGGK